jgi:3-oxoacyl-[acyl-carrier protein] reductase
MSKVAIVTGGGSGIGKAIAHAFVNDGYQVIIIGRTESKLQTAVEELGTSASYQVADVGIREQVETIVNNIVTEHQEINVLVNNAGFVGGISTEDDLAEAEAKWDAVMNANLKGAFLMSVACAKHMSNEHGRIINMGSIAAYTGGSRGGVLAYSSAKMGMHGLTVGLARELAPKGITVNTVHPGLILETDFFGEPLQQEAIDRRVIEIPVNRPGVPSDIADAVLFLCSEKASYITGEAININGGWLFSR